MNRNLKVMLWNGCSTLANLGVFQKGLDESNLNRNDDLKESGVGVVGIP